MKQTILSIAFFPLFIATSAMASGTHAGGHHGESDAIGQAGKASEVTRSVSVDMTDEMRFIPSSITVKQGETVRITVSNSGKLKHEMVLGTEAELKEHYEAMKKFPEMEHDDANQVTVMPGKSREIIWKFTRAGTINFACLQPGHYDAGMKGAFKVSGSKVQKQNHTH
ncbi:MAG: cupredoxin family protein [Candidatus Methylopumilus sp.]